MPERNGAIDWVVRAVIGVAMVLLTMLTAAFWRWADSLDELETTTQSAVATLSQGQTMVLVKLAELEGRLERTDALAARVELVQQRQYVTLREELARLREHIERVEGSVQRARGTQP